MVLRTFGINDCSIFDLEEFCGTRSIWTVDLAYLLKKFSIDFSFFTITLGANPDFSSEVFYKEQLLQDQGRVDTLFKKALEAGIHIEHRSLSGNEISLLILSGQYIAIALVDKYKLSYAHSKDTCLSGVNDRLPNYIGHFIVICGYDKENDEFDIRDSASCRKHKRISLLCLDDARKSFGTDEDILLISLTGEEGQ
ncbi:guanylyl cyclase 1 isoform X2 [Wolffia australiana]